MLDNNPRAQSPSTLQTALLTCVVMICHDHVVRMTFLGVVALVKDERVYPVHLCLGLLVNGVTVGGIQGTECLGYGYQKCHKM